MNLSEPSQTLTSLRYLDYYFLYKWVCKINRLGMTRFCGVAVSCVVRIANHQLVSVFGADHLKESVEATIDHSFIFCSHFNSPLSLKNFTPLNASLFLNIAPSFFDAPINN